MSVTTNGVPLAELPSAQLAGIGRGPMKWERASLFAGPNLVQAKAAISVLGERAAAGGQ